MVRKRANNNPNLTSRNDVLNNHNRELDLDTSIYNPYEHRNVKYPTTYFETLIHLLKASLGTGILAMPSAFRNAGYLVGTIGTISAGCLCTYTIHLLIRSSYRLCVKRKVSSLTYPGTAAAAFEEGPQSLKKFGIWASILIKSFLVIYQIGTNCIYIVFISSNLKSVSDIYFKFPYHSAFYTLCLFPFVFALVMVKNLKLLAPFSSLANCLTCASLLSICYYILKVPLTFSEKEPVGSITSIPLFFGAVLFAMEAIGMVLPLENEMENPKRFGSKFGVLNVSMVPITLLYTFVGLIGYLRFGKSTNTNGITLDLPQGEILPQFIKVFLSLSIFISYALSNYVAYDIIWKSLFKEKSEYKLMINIGIRTALVAITFALAILIPNLDGLITLIGAFCLSAIGIAFPAIINHLTFYRDYQVRGKIVYFMFCVRNCFIFLISIFACVIGVFTSVNNIIHHGK